MTPQQDKAISFLRNLLPDENLTIGGSPTPRGGRPGRSITP